MEPSMLSQAYGLAATALRKAAAVAVRTWRWLTSPEHAFSVGTAAVAAIGVAVAIWRISTSSLAGTVQGENTVYILVISLVVLIFWLSTHEVANSIIQVRGFESGTRSRRDALERRMAERTGEFMDAEWARLSELQRVAQFGKLSQGLFHDLMSPLSALSLYMDELPGRDPDPAQSREIVRRAVEVSKRMRSFMANVKECLGDEEALAAKARSDLSHEFSIVHDLLAYKARMSGVTLRFDCDEQMTLPAHPVRVQQMLMNLVSNAIDACAPDARETYDGKQRTVRTKAVKENNIITITVADDGCGIPAERLAVLFDHPFTTKADGSGLGLGIVKSIAENELHASIAVTSVVNRGTTFTLTIPEMA